MPFTHSLESEAKLRFIKFEVKCRINLLTDGSFVIH